MKIKSGFVLDEVGGCYIAVAVGERANEFSSLIKLNSTGAFIWKLMVDKDVKREDVIEGILAVYEGVSREQVAKDVDNILAVFENAGILE